MRRAGEFSVSLLLRQGFGAGFGADVRTRAERHPLSGVGRLLPWSYVMVYAPRDDEEFQVWAKMAVAGCRFVSGGKEIKLVES